MSAAASLDRPNKRAQMAEATRDRLIEAAARLFARNGYTASSVAAIGEEAGLSRGLVNFHFETKERLLHAVLERLVAELEERMFPQRSPSDPLRALGVLVDAHRSFVVETPERARLLFRLQAEALNPELGLHAFADLHDRWLERTRRWWQDGLAAGQLDPSLDHNAITTVAIGALRGIGVEWLLAPEAVDVDASYAQLRRVLDAGLRPRADGA